jgi:transitional endoplasmic reticulum ATPase
MPTAQEVAVAQLLSVLGGQPQVHVAGVVRHGEKIILPQGMSTADAIESLKRQLRYDNEVVQMNFDFPYFVWDGAHALAKVMQKRYGFVFGEKTRSMFGSKPPQLIGIETEIGTTVQVPWGKFSVPSIEEGVFECGYTMKEGKLLFKLSVTCKHMYEDDIKKLHSEVEAYLKTNSIYKGKAFSIRFTDDDGEKMLDNGEVPTPKFLDVAKDREMELVFPRDVQAQIETNLFTVLERIDEVRASGIPVKRGILLAGNYGVGKTLTAYVAAHKAVKSGITYIYCQKPEEFPDVMRLAAQYAPALVFCEDVDRIVPSERDKAVDELINIIDGVETKNVEIVTVFTTNAVNNVNKSLLRPGRMDAVIVVKEADSEAVQRLIKNYAGKFLEPGIDLTEIGDLLAGNIPAVIREVCERSKLAAMRLTPKGKKLDIIPVPALREASLTMKMQLDLLGKQDEPKKEGLEQVAESIAAVATALGNTPKVVTTPASRTAKVPTAPGATNGEILASTSTD